MKQECKRAPDREVRYVAFKSYHAKPPAPSVAAQSTKLTSRVTRPTSTIDQRTKATIKKPTKKPATVIHQSVSKLKGDSAEHTSLQEELGRVRQKEAELRDALKTLQTENESLKQSLSASVTLVKHQLLEEQLREALNKCANIGANAEQLLEQNSTLQQNVKELNEKLESVNCRNEELQDRIELSIDKANYLEKKVEEVEAKAATAQSQLEETQSQLQQTQSHLQRTQSQLLQTQNQLEQVLSELQQTQSQLQQTENQLQEMVARNGELTAANERSKLTVQNLQNVVEEQRLKMEDFAMVKRKLRSTELEVQKVVEEREVSSKFVELMESENSDMKLKNSTLQEQNAKLNKDLVDMKRKIEHMRQKFDEVNKENKVLKEKETRCLIHERINVSKYAKYPPTLPDKEDRVSDLRSTNSVFRLAHFPTATVPRRPKNTNEFDYRMHHLLHRANSVDRLLKAKSRKN